MEQLRDDNIALRYTAQHLDMERRDNASLQAAVQDVKQLMDRNDQLRQYVAQLPGLRAEHEELLAAQKEVSELAAVVGEMQMNTDDLQNLRQQHRQLQGAVQEVRPPAASCFYLKRDDCTAVQCPLCCVLFTSLWSNAGISWRPGRPLQAVRGPAHDSKCQLC